MSGSFTRKLLDELEPALCGVLRSTVTSEIRACALLNEHTPRTGVPADIDAEQEVTSALLCGDVLPLQLAPLEPKHFYSRVFRCAFEAASEIAAAGQPVNVTDVLGLLAEQGLAGSAVRRELAQVADTTPYCTRPVLSQHVARLIELWRRRELLRVLGEVDALLRIDQLTHEGALERLRVHVREVRRG